MYADLFFDFPGAQDLPAAATAAYRALGVTQFDERESSNYVDGRYFLAKQGQLNLEIALSDDEDADDLRFWLSIEGELEGSSELEFDQMIDVIAKQKLQAAGARVARVYDFGKKTMRVAKY